MGMLSEFKAFAMRGNVMDLAVGVVIGAAFGKIVTSLVDQIIMPPIGVLIGGVDFSSYKWVLHAAGPDGKGEVAVLYGAFLNTIIQFLIPLPPFARPISCARRLPAILPTSHKNWSNYSRGSPDNCWSADRRSCPARRVPAGLP